MPRHAKQAAPQLPERTLVIDNGAFTMKAGFTSTKSNTTEECHVVPNCIAKAKNKKIYVADQILQCTDFAEMAFRRPMEKGYVVNWDSEMDIWRQVYFDEEALLHCEPHDTNLLLTEASNCPQQLQSNCDQIVFEELEFASYCRIVGPALNAWNDIPVLMGDSTLSTESSPTPRDCVLVIDSGYSSTTVTPVLHGRPIQSAIRRLDIGGKFLSNRFMELISLRHYSMMEEPYLVNQIKEDVSFVSQDFKGDLESTWKGGYQDIPRTFNSRNIVVDYVLPDYTPEAMRGHIRAHDPSLAAKQKRLGVAQAAGEDFIPLGNERFTIPELFFHPSDLRMDQAGIPELVVQCLALLPENLWPAMVANVLVVGGNCKIRGFLERLENDLRPLIASELILRVRSPADPISYTWHGGARMASHQENIRSLFVSRKDYLEHGSAWASRKLSTGVT